MKLQFKEIYRNTDEVDFVSFISCRIFDTVCSTQIKYDIDTIALVL